MPVTIPYSFTVFGENIALTDAQKDTVKTRRNTIAKRLKTCFPVPNSLSIRETKLIGSAGRATMIRPPDDIDLLAVFYDEDFEQYRYDSQKFLYRVKTALDEGGASVVGARGQAVRIFYTSGVKVDVAPVFRRSGGGYLLPKGDGTWISTDPDYHASHSSQRNSELNGHLKPFVRMLKAWNRAHSARLKSFHLEVMVGNIFSSMGGNYRKASEIFFGSAEYHLHDQDPSGHGGDLGSRLTYSQEEAIQQSFRSAHERAQRAIAAEDRDDAAEAIRLWRIIYGSDFPSYG